MNLVAGMSNETALDRIRANANQSHGMRRRVLEGLMGRAMSSSRMRTPLELADQAWVRQLPKSESTFRDEL